jgi:L-aminopeptidase/D-esterase-like protein
MKPRAFALAIAIAGAAAMPLPAQSRSAVSRGLTDVEGLTVGHHTLTERPTGCTVVLLEAEGATGGVAQRGASPGTRETDLLDPLNLVDKVNAIVLAGGSAFGLDAAQGVVRYLDERKIGWRVGAAGVVPIVPAAILFDLSFGGDPAIRPTADCGYRAAQAASAGPVAEGNVGAGAGATVGKTFGAARAMKGGTGSASFSLPNGLVVAAIAAVNARGDVIDAATGRVVAGARTADGRSLADVRTLVRSGALTAAPPQPAGNTTIAVVATNARLTKTEVNRIALMADDGIARAVWPSHTVSDGDTVFAVATGRWNGTIDLTTIGALAADAVSEAIVRAVSRAQAAGGLPAATDLGTVPARLK